MKKDTISIQIQSVIFDTDKNSIKRSLQSIDNSLRNYLQKNNCFITVSYGDISKNKLFSQEDIINFKKSLNNINLQYSYLGSKTGISKGHNILANKCKSDYILIIKPDIIFESNLLENLIISFEDETVGIVEAKQLPIEHLKDYNFFTGETDWVAGECFMLPFSIWKYVDGFDENLFLNFYNVDISLQVRAKGYKIKYNPYACVFNPQFLSNECNYQQSTEEQYYSIEGFLIMLYKWSNCNILNKLLKKYQHSSGLENKAYKVFIDKKAKGLLKKYGNEKLNIDFFNLNKIMKNKFW